MNALYDMLLFTAFVSTENVHFRSFCRIKISQIVLEIFNFIKDIIFKIKIYKYLFEGFMSIWSVSQIINHTLLMLTVIDWASMMDLVNSLAHWKQYIINITMMNNLVKLTSIYNMVFRFSSHIAPIIKNKINNMTFKNYILGLHFFFLQSVCC